MVVSAPDIARCEQVKESAISIAAGGDKFRALIRPNNSMSPSAMVAFVIGFACIAVTIGSTFYLLGFWLILPFAGLEIAIVVAAVVYANYRSKDYELVTVDAQKVTVVQCFGGRTFARDFQRYWTQVRQEKGANRLSPSNLMIGSHGQFIVVGTALTEEMKNSLARHLRNVICQRVHNNLSE